jgi:hypothetical protein
MTQLHAEMAEQTASTRELKARLTELAGIAADQAMSIEENLDEILKRHIGTAVRERAVTRPRRLEIVREGACTMVVEEPQRQQSYEPVGRNAGSTGVFSSQV